MTALRAGSGLAAVAAPGAPSRARRFTWAASDVAVMAHRYVLQLVRVPSVLVFTLLQPMMFVLLFRYVFGGAIHVPGRSYVEYMIPGAIGQTAAFGTFGTAIGLNIDRQRGLIERVRAMPTARLAVLLGRLTSDVIRATLVFVVLVGIGYAVGFRFLDGAGPGIAMVVVAIAFALSLDTIGATIGLSLRDTEAVQGFGLIWVFPLTFVSTAFVPIESMPGWLQAVARPNPVSLLTESMRALAYGGPLAIHLLETLAWTVGIMAVFVPLSVRAYRKAS